MSDFCESKNKVISYFIEIRLVGAELFLSDGQTDGRTNLTRLIDAFRNFANAAEH